VQPFNFCRNFISAACIMVFCNPAFASMQEHRSSHDFIKLYFSISSCFVFQRSIDCTAHYMGSLGSSFISFVFH
jgi:hypothetical protein